MEKIDYDWKKLKKRYIGLDFLKIISIFTICAFHTTIHLGANYGVLQQMLSVGSVFMTAFFILSGYFLFVNYSSENMIKISNFKRFLIKRFIGIIPMYYIAAIFFILFSLILYKFFGIGNMSIYHEIFLAPAEILGIQVNFHSLFWYSHNSGTWFISCILMCYIVFPFIQEIVKQISTKTKIILCAIIIIILFYSPILEIIFPITGIYANPFFRILEFSLGIIIASMKPVLDKNEFVKKYIYNIWSVLLINVIMVICVSIAVNSNIYTSNVMLYSIICLPCFIVMVIGLSGLNSKKLEASPVVKYCVNIGYVFFLAQLYSNTISKIIINKLNIQNNIIIILIGWGTCIIISVILHELFEKPIKRFLSNKLKRITD